MFSAVPVANAGGNGGSLAACAGLSGGGISGGGMSGGCMSSGGLLVLAADFSLTSSFSVERECLVVLISRSRPSALEWC